MRSGTVQVGPRRRRWPPLHHDRIRPTRTFPSTPRRTGPPGSRRWRTRCVWRSSRWASSAPRSLCCGSIRSAASTAPAAPGAKAVAEEATLRRVTRAFFAEHSMADLAGKSDYWLGQQGRLTEPMYRAPDADHYQPVGWPEAFRITADALP